MVVKAFYADERGQTSRVWGGRRATVLKLVSLYTYNEQAVNHTQQVVVVPEWAFQFPTMVW